MDPNCVSTGCGMDECLQRQLRRLSTGERELAVFGGASIDNELQRYFRARTGGPFISKSGYR